MFTSRAEYRLLLRHDNAAERLSHIGHGLGLLSDDQVASVSERTALLEEAVHRLGAIRIRGGEGSDAILESLGTTAIGEPQSAAQLLRRPQVSFSDLESLMERADADWFASLPAEVVEQIEVRAQYDGYIQRQLAEISHRMATEDTVIPADLPVGDLAGITVEARDKLGRIRPLTLGQASRIAGVSPADISVLMMHIHRHKSLRTEQEDSTAEPSAVGE